MRFFKPSSTLYYGKHSLSIFWNDSSHMVLQSVRFTPNFKVRVRSPRRLTVFFLCYPFYSKLSTLRIGKTRRPMNLLQGRQVLTTGRPSWQLISRLSPRSASEWAGMVNNLDSLFWTRQPNQFMTWLGVTITVPLHLFVTHGRSLSVLMSPYSWTANERASTSWVVWVVQKYELTS